MILLAAILGGLAAAWAVRSATVTVAEAVRRYRERYGIETARDFAEILPLLDRPGVRALAAAGCVLLAALGALATGGIGGISGALAGAIGPVALVRWLRVRRIRRFEEQLLDALETAASGLQAGLSLLQALEVAASESEAPLRDELGLALRSVRLGASVEEALGDMEERVPSEELALFAAGTVMARQVGGNLASSYRTIADSLRERFRVEGKLRALAAQGRMQGRVVGALPLLLAVVLHWMRPDLVEPLLAHPAGWALVAAVVVLEIVGFYWIRLLLRPAW